MIDSNTILIVIGDHGMSESGNHGGNSPLETDTVLFFYSK
jgi:phosphatidylinositol glycan class O